MKQFMLAATMLLATAFCNAQDHRPMKPPPPEQRWERESQKFAETIKPAAAQLQQLKVVFFSFYKDMDALHDNNKETRPPKEAMDKILDQRRADVKKVLSATDFEKFKTIERELGPPRGKPGNDRPAYN